MVLYPPFPVATQGYAHTGYVALAAASAAAGEPLPLWGDLPEETRVLWCHAAAAIEIEVGRVMQANARR